MTDAGSFLTKWERVIKETSMPKKEAYNDGYTHEALHTAHVLIDTWDQHVVDTRCCSEFPDVKEAADRAITAMHEVYQLIGAKFTDDAPTQS